MDVLGICAVCAAPASSTCALCGRQFCDDHMSPGGVCVFCAGGKAGDGQKTKQPIPCQRKGVR